MFVNILSFLYSFIVIDIFLQIVSIMRFLIVLAVVIAAVSAKRVPLHQPLSRDIIDYVNFKANTTWKVIGNDVFILNFRITSM